LPSSYGPRCSITAFLSVAYISMFSTRMASGRFKTMQIFPVLSQTDVIPLKSSSLICFVYLFHAIILNFIAPIRWSVRILKLVSSASEIR
jgi:hypothetical protein